MADNWETYTPNFAPHITGRYAVREFEPDGMPKSQQWTAHCGKCDRTHRGFCDSGQVRKHIKDFAMRHLHDDALAAPRVTSPGSLRVGKPDT